MPLFVSVCACVGLALGAAAQTTKPTRTATPDVEDVREIRVRLDRRVAAVLGAPRATPGGGPLDRTIGRRVLTMLRDYSAVEAEAWKHSYSHIAGRDRFGTLVLEGGAEWRWFLRPGGLGWLIAPDGSVIHLASVVHGRRTPRPMRPKPKPPLPDVPVHIDGIDAMLANAKNDARERFEVVRTLSNAPNQPGVLTFLIAVASDATEDVTTRNHAALGLRTAALESTESKDVVLDALIAVLARDVRGTPDEVVRTLARCGRADDVAKTLGDAIARLPTEIYVLERCAPESARENLWKVYTRTPASRHPRDYAIHSEVARALLAVQDRRGVDILLALSASDAAPGPQYRHNNFASLTKALKTGDFGYPHANFDPSLDAAVTKATAWWKENRETFTFE